MDGQQYRALAIAQAGIADTDTEGKTLATYSSIGERLYWYKDAIDGAAGDATVERPVARMISNARVLSMNILPAAALTGDATNNAVITIGKRTAGGASTTLATITTTANWVAHTPIALTLANVTLASADTIGVAITKGGTGVAVPAFTLEINVARSNEVSSATQ